jgi:hypothetical protein
MDETVSLAGRRPSAAALPISGTVWSRLVAANEQAVVAGWATRGVFATGIGPDYQPGSSRSLLYVGKSAGPLGQAVGSCADQAESGAASTEWMMSRRNKSSFWQFVEKIDPTRRHIAWTNICKMDRLGGARPPSDGEWSQVADVCMAALEDEMHALKPHVALFATSGLYQTHIDRLLPKLGYGPNITDINDGWTSCLRSQSNSFLILTRHPQGWPSASRDKVVSLVLRLLDGGAP